MNPLEASSSRVLVSGIFLSPLAICGRLWKALPPMDQEVSLKKIVSMVQRFLLSIGIGLAVIPGFVGVCIKYPPIFLEVLKAPLINCLTRWNGLSPMSKKWNIKKAGEIINRIILVIGIAIALILSLIAVFMEPLKEQSWVTINLDGEESLSLDANLVESFEKLIYCEDPEDVIGNELKKGPSFSSWIHWIELPILVEECYARHFHFGIEPLFTVGTALKNIFNQGTFSFSLTHSFIEIIAQRFLGIRTNPLSNEEKRFLVPIREICLAIFINRNRQPMIQLSLSSRA